MAIHLRGRRLHASRRRALDWTALARLRLRSEANKSADIGVADILRKDLGDNKYILTGQLTPSIFSDDCEFTDPNNSVRGLSKYQQALSLLLIRARARSS